MRNLCMLAAVGLLASCSNSGKYEVVGSVNPELNGSKVYLQTLNENVEYQNIDSAIVADGAFEFKGGVTKPEMAAIQVMAQGVAPVSFILENAEIKTQLNAPVQVSGTAANDSLQVYYNYIQSQSAKMQQIVDTYQTKQNNQTLTPEEEEDLMRKYDALESEIQIFVKSYLESNIQSLAGVYVLSRSLNDLPANEVEALAAKILPDIQESPIVARVNDYVDGVKRSSVGAQFTNLTMPDLQGNNVSLSDYVGKGKYVLIDFWASWCGPCRREMPIVLEAYNKYADKGFEVVGVSFDDNKEAWEKGVAELGITWPQMSDLKGWKSEAASVYGIRSIPSTLLVDPQGKIIAKNLRGEDLEKTLAEYLK